MAYVTIEVCNVNATEFDFSLVQRNRTALCGGSEHSWSGFHHIAVSYLRLHRLPPFRELFY